MCKAVPRGVVWRTDNAGASDLHRADGAFAAVWQPLWLIHLFNDGLVSRGSSVFCLC